MSIKPDAANPDVVAGWRQLFPMLQVSEHDQPLVYFNNAATALTPTPVIAAMTEYYTQYGVNIARGVDAIGYQATQKFEDTRTAVARFMNARSADEIIFTRGTTASLNMVCRGLGDTSIQPGDEIVISDSEHHANYVPWQQLALRRQAKLVLVPTDANGVVQPDALAGVMTDRTRIVALFHVSNVMGGTNDLKALAAVVHARNAIFVCDGAQGIVHHAVDVQAADVDFYAFSGHKLFGPTGVGVLYGKLKLLKQMAPVEFGGEMIDTVDVYETTFADPPHRFEAGTMPIAEVIGLGAAIELVQTIGYPAMQAQVRRLGERLIAGLQKLPNVELYNPNNVDSGVISFNIKGVHPHDAAGIYDRESIALRAGQHCSQPTMRCLNQQSTLRASVAFYNTEAEVDRFVAVTEQAGDFLDVLF